MTQSIDTFHFEENSVVNEIIKTTDAIASKSIN